MPNGAKPRMTNLAKVFAVNGTNVIPRADQRGPVGAGSRQAARSGLADASGQAERCYHCGEPCHHDGQTIVGRSFCCVGCRTVFALLTESGLEQFYEFGSTPGAKVGEATTAQRWTFLDDAEVEGKLLDFASAIQAKVTLRLPAIHCIACVWLLENLFRLRQGIGESRVNFARREVSITFARAQVKLSELVALLTSLGYEPALTLGELDPVKDTDTPQWRQKQWLQIGVAGFGFGNIMLLALPGYLGLDSLSSTWFKALAGWLSLALALPVLVYSASDYWRAAWFGLRQRVLTLDLPIALGLAAIYGQSLLEVGLARGEGYSDSLTGLIFFLLCGRMFQRKTFDRLAFDRDYKEFFPLAALRKTSRGEESVSIAQLTVGDRLLVRHGELIPADSRIISGEGLLDYSFVTGESDPVTRRPGEHLYAGGRQMGGAIEVETVKPVSTSYLTSLWNNDIFSKHRDDNRDSLTNRYSRRFTGMVISIAVGAAVFWMFTDARVALKAFTSVLIVACPCALALAAPLTLGTAQRWLGRRNIFLRNAQVIERVSEVDMVVFDKTGTLTSSGEGTVTWHGAPDTLVSEGNPGLTPDEERWICMLARHSTHPLALRISRALTAGQSTDCVTGFSEVSGCGIGGRLGGGRFSWAPRLG